MIGKINGLCVFMIVRYCNNVMVMWFIILHWIISFCCGLTEAHDMVRQFYFSFKREIAINALVFVAQYN